MILFMNLNTDSKRKKSSICNLFIFHHTYIYHYIYNDTRTIYE